MKILIIEDEQSNASRLVRLLGEIMPSADAVTVLASNAQVTAHFQRHADMPDVILSDIQLGDGLSFESLRSVPDSIPIIFTTAYDEYAIQAFKFNSIDYLLKPIDREELGQALHRAARQSPSTTDAIRQLLSSVQGQHIRYRERFLVSYRDTFSVIPANKVSHIAIADGVVRLYTTSGKMHTLNIPLDELEGQLDPVRFMRANRQFIVNAAAIEKLSTFFLGKIRIHLKGYPDINVIVSRDKVATVKRWLDA